MDGNYNAAWQLAMELILRQVIADNYHSANKEQFQTQLDGLLSDTVTAITNVQFAGATAAENEVVKQTATEIVHKLIGSIQPA